MDPSALVSSCHGNVTVRRQPDGTPRRTHLFDGWGRHPAPFSTTSLTSALRAARAQASATIGDPFAGSARAGTRAVGRGHRFVGIEAHPLIGELASIKLSRPGPEEELLLAVDELLGEPLGMDWDLDHESPAVRRFVSIDALPALCELRGRIASRPGPWSTHLRWALLSVVRSATASGWPYGRTGGSGLGADAVANAVRAAVETMASDLSAAPVAPDARLLLSDSRLPETWDAVPAESWDAVVSSPPYLNQLNYLEATRLELLFLQPAQSPAQMRRDFGAGLLRSSTQQVTVRPSEEAWENLQENVPRVYDSLLPIAEQLLLARRTRPQGKPYDRLLPCYFAEIAAVLSFQLRAMAAGSRAVWVIGDSAPYGIRVDTPALIGQAAVSLGYELIGDQQIRSRGKRWETSRRAGLSLSERMIVLRRPSSGAVQLPLPGL